MLYTLSLTISTVMLFNACFSVMQYRKHQQLIQSDEPIELTQDILLEIYIAVAVGVIGLVFGELTDLKRTRLQAI